MTGNPPLGNPRPTEKARACLADKMCPHVPVDEVFIENVKAPGGGYWLPVCRVHLDAINNRKCNTDGGSPQGSASD